MKRLIGELSRGGGPEKIYRDDDNGKYYSSVEKGVFLPVDIELLTACLSSPWTSHDVEISPDGNSAEITSLCYDTIDISIFGKAHHELSAIEDCVGQVIEVFADRIKELGAGERF